MAASASEVVPEKALFSERFRRVSNRYPRQVAMAYLGNLRGALEATDDEVAAVVAAFEKRMGIVPIDWHAVGREERAEDDS